MQNWLSGHEYAFIIRHYRAYLQCYPDKMQLSEKGHPANIYEQPKGMLFLSSPLCKLGSCTSSGGGT